jgi:hypothetical protein
MTAKPTVKAHVVVVPRGGTSRQVVLVVEQQSFTIEPTFKVEAGERDPDEAAGQFAMWLVSALRKTGADVERTPRAEFGARHL